MQDVYRENWNSHAADRRMDERARERERERERDRKVFAWKLLPNQQSHHGDDSFAHPPLFYPHTRTMWCVIAIPASRVVRLTGERISLLPSMTLSLLLSRVLLHCNPILIHSSHLTTSTVPDRVHERYAYSSSLKLAVCESAGGPSSCGTLSPPLTSSRVCTTGSQTDGILFCLRRC